MDFDDLDDYQDAENGGTINGTGGSDDMFLFSGMN
jgi:hypothetical protein